MNSVFLIDFICKRQRKRDREKKMQATRMRCRPQSRAPAPRCFVLPSRSVSHATNFVGDIQWGAMQDFFSLFLNLCMDFIFTRCSVNTAILCAFGWCYNLFFLIHRAESITRCEKKSYKNVSWDFIVKKGGNIWRVRAHLSLRCWVVLILWQRCESLLSCGDFLRL